MPVAFGREATAIANDPDGRAVVHFADGGRLSGPGHRRGRTYVLGGAGPCGGRQRAGLSRLRQLDRRGRKLARPGGRRLDPRYWGHGERVGIVALGRRKVYWAGAQARTLEQARASAAAAGRRVAQGAPPVRALARSHRRGHRCHAASGPAPDRGARPGAAGPLASRQCAAGGRCRARTLAHVGTGRLPGARDAWHLARCLEDPAMGSGAELEQALERFGGLRREKTEAITRQARYFARELFITDPQACRERDARAPAIRCKACMRWRKAGGGPAFACAGRSRGGHRCRQRRGTVAVTSATRWLGGRGEAWIEARVAARPRSTARRHHRLDPHHRRRLAARVRARTDHHRENATNTAPGPAPRPWPRRAASPSRRSTAAAPPAAAARPG